jgi:hypothetical protein
MGTTGFQASRQCRNKDEGVKEGAKRERQRAHTREGLTVRLLVCVCVCQFELLAARHPQEDVGLFTCGGASMLAHVQKACDHVNAFKGSHFHHHAEQFQ